MFPTLKRKSADQHVGKSKTCFLPNLISAVSMILHVYDFCQLAEALSCSAFRTKGQVNIIARYITTISPNPAPVWLNIIHPSMRPEHKKCRRSLGVRTTASSLPTTRCEVCRASSLRNRFPCGGIQGW